MRCIWSSCFFTVVKPFFKIKEKILQNQIRISHNSCTPCLKLIIGPSFTLYKIYLYVDLVNTDRIGLNINAMNKSVHVLVSINDIQIILDLIIFALFVNDNNTQDYSLVVIVVNSSLNYIDLYAMEIIRILVAKIRNEHDFNIYYSQHIKNLSPLRKCEIFTTDVVTPDTLYTEPRFYIIAYNYYHVIIPILNHVKIDIIKLEVVVDNVKMF